MKKNSVLTSLIVLLRKYSGKGRIIIPVILLSIFSSTAYSQALFAPKQTIGQEGGTCRVTSGDSKGKTGTYSTDADGHTWCDLDDGKTSVECTSGRCEKAKLIAPQSLKNAGDLARCIAGCRGVGDIKAVKACIKACKEPDSGSQGSGQGPAGAQGAQGGGQGPTDKQNIEDLIKCINMLIDILSES